MTPEYENLQKALQDLVNSKEEQPSIISSAIVIWEVMTFGENSEPEFAVDYSQVSETASLISCLGLCEAGSLKMKNLITAMDQGEDE